MDSKFLRFWTLLPFFILSCSNAQNNRFLNQDFKCENCNVILIDITVLRADHLGSYGYQRGTSPNIGHIANKSFVFNNAISTSSWTLPSSMSVFTSTYPSQHGLKNNNVRNTEGKLIKANLKKLNPHILTLAEVLKKNNYATAGFTGDAHLNKTYGYGSGFDVYYDSKPFAGFETTLPLALNWLKETKNKKFFLFIQGYDLHGRYELQNDSSRKFIDMNYNGIYKGTQEEQLILRNLSLDQGYVNLSQEDKEFWISLYDSKLYDADQRLGKFLSEIEKLGILNKSIIIIIGDHGEELFDRNRIDHGFSLYDELIHVPLIIHLPINHEQRLIQDQVRTIDVMPTIFNLIGVDASDEINNQIKGVSLVPLMQGQHMSLDAFSETDYLYKVFKRSIRGSNNWKLIYSLDSNERELYNLNDDPDEKNNLIEKEPRIAYELEQRLFKQMYG